MLQQFSSLDDNEDQHQQSMPTMPAISQEETKRNSDLVQEVEAYPDEEVGASDSPNRVGIDIIL